MDGEGPNNDLISHPRSWTFGEASIWLLVAEHIVLAPAILVSGHIGLLSDSTMFDLLYTIVRMDAIGMVLAGAIVAITWVVGTAIRKWLDRRSSAGDHE